MDKWVQDEKVAEEARKIQKARPWTSGAEVARMRRIVEEGKISGSSQAALIEVSEGDDEQEAVKHASEGATKASHKSKKNTTHTDDPQDTDTKMPTPTLVGDISNGLMKCVLEGIPNAIRTKAAAYLAKGGGYGRREVPRDLKNSAAFHYMSYALTEKEEPQTLQLASAFNSARKEEVKVAEKAKVKGAKQEKLQRKHKADNEVAQLKAKVLQAQAVAEKAKQDAEEVKQTAQKAKEETDKAKKDAQKAKEETDKAKKDSQKAKQDTDKAKKDAQKAKQDAEEATEAMTKARSHARALYRHYHRSSTDDTSAPVKA